MEDVKIYGETASKDCPSGNVNNADCYCEDKFGLMLFGNNLEGKEIHPEYDSLDIPIYKITSDSTWLANVEIKDTEFKKFESPTTDCGAE